MNELQAVKKIYEKTKKPVTARDIQDLVKKNRGNTLAQLKSYVKINQLYCLGQFDRNQYFFMPKNN